MADFDKALAITLDYEGGYVNDPIDRGGETYKGISRRSHPDWKGWTMLKKDYLDSSSYNKLEQAVHDLYLKEYWMPCMAAAIKDQAVGEKYFDMCVNMGQGNATRVLQLAVEVFMPIKVDAHIGPKTIKCVNGTGKGLIKVLKILSGNYYLRIIAEKPNQIRYLNGWLRRALEG